MNNDDFHSQQPLFSADNFNNTSQLNDNSETNINGQLSNFNAANDIPPVLSDIKNLNDAPTVSAPTMSALDSFEEATPASSQSTDVLNNYDNSASFAFPQTSQTNENTDSVVNNTTFMPSQLNNLNTYETPSYSVPAPAPYEENNIESEQTNYDNVLPAEISNTNIADTESEQTNISEDIAPSEKESLGYSVPAPAPSEENNAVQEPTNDISEVQNDGLLSNEAVPKIDNDTNLQPIFEDPTQTAVEDVLQPTESKDQPIEEKGYKISDLGLNIPDTNIEQIDTLDLNDSESTENKDSSIDNFQTSIDKIKDLINDMKASGSKIELEEFDFENMYQLVIKISK